MAIKRQEIIDNLRTQLENISTANGYYTDCGTTVKVWDPTVFERKELPALNIMDRVDVQPFDANSTQGEVIDHELTVEIAALCAAGVTSDSFTRQMIADIYKAIKADESLSGKAMWIEPVQDEIGVEESGKRVGGATITIKIVYRTQKFSES